MKLWTRNSDLLHAAYHCSFESPQNLLQSSLFLFLSWQSLCRLFVIFCGFLGRLSRWCYWCCHSPAWQSSYCNLLVYIQHFQNFMTENYSLLYLWNRMISGSRMSFRHRSGMLILLQLLRLDLYLLNLIVGLEVIVCHSIQLRFQMHYIMWLCHTVTSVMYEMRSFNGICTLHRWQAPFVWTNATGQERINERCNRFSVKLIQI